MKYTRNCVNGFAARPLALEISRMFGAPLVGATLLVAMAVPPIAFAEPKGGAVVAGQATIATAGSTTTINQASQRAVIDWRSFSVGPTETVNFQQPNASSSTLNRVLGNDPSAIFGRITANGTVLLVNPNGILFGRTAQVDVGGLVASTANIANTDFMAGKLAFTEPGRQGATVENQGTITIGQGGLAAFVGRGVSNSGVIHARLGKVSLAAGDAFVLDLYGDKLVNLIVDSAVMQTMTDASGMPLAARVDHSGQIVAEGGVVQLTAATVKQLVDNVINVGGVIRATSFDTAPGLISLRGDANTRLAVSGTLDASGTRGGRIEVTARDVLLTEAARVDASGSTGGGTVAIGGDWQGRGALPNAQTVSVASGASIDASAIASGLGGTVSVWADGDTRFVGAIAARGGSAGGDGGNIEVSGKARLAFDGDVTASASSGSAGSVLLDPTNIVISATGGALPGSSTAGDFTVGVDSVRRVLLTGTNVGMTATNDITVNTVIDGRSTAGGASGGGLRLEAGRNVSINESVILNNGSLAISAGGHLTQAANTVVSTGTGSMNLTGATGVQLGQLVTNGGAVTIASSQGTVVVDTPIVGTGSTGRAGTLTATGKGITLNGGRVSDFSLTNGDAAQTVQLLGSLDATGAGQVLSAGGATLANVTSAGFTLSGVAGAGTAASSLSLSGSLTSTGTGLVDLRTVNGLTLTATGGVAAGGSLKLLAGGALSTAAGSAIVAAGPANLTAANLVIGGGLQAGGTGSSELTATSGSITLGAAAAVKAVGSGALIFTGTGFVQNTGAKVQSGSGGTTIRAGSANLTATALVSTGSVSLSGANVTVTESIVGPDTSTALAAALTVEAAGQATLAGGRFGGGVDITAITPSTATRGGITLNGTLLAGGTLRMATDGDTSLQAVKSASIGLADTLGSSAGRSGGNLALHGDVDSAGATRFGLAGAFSTDSNVKVTSAGALGIEAASILVRGGSGTGVSADSAGLNVSGAASMTLTASGDDVTTAPATVRPALLAEGSLRTQGGDLTLKTTGSGSIRVAQLQTVAPVPTDAAQARSSLNGVLDIQSTQGSVVLSEALGGNLTGYANYSDGYVARNRPLVGAVTISAATGIETNGLNIDGQQAAGTGAPGEPNGLTLKLTGTSPGVIIVNKTVAVNKGAVEIDAGAGDVLIGASIFSRGYDVAEAGRTAISAPPAMGAANNAKIGYSVSIKGATLAFWDADLGMALLPVKDPVRKDPLTNVPLTLWLVGKITVGNNAANYTDVQPSANGLPAVDNTATLVPSSATTLPAIVSLNGILKGLNTSPESSLRLGGTLPLVIALSDVPNQASPTGNKSDETNGLGVSVKVLTFTNAGDSASDLSGALPICRYSCGFGRSTAETIKVDPGTIIRGTSTGAIVSGSGLSGELSSAYTAIDNSPSFNGSAYIRNVLVVLGSSSDLKNQGSRTLYFPGILASTSLTGFLDTTHTTNVGNLTTSLPSNSSVTAFGSIGSFGNTQTQNLVIATGSSVGSFGPASQSRVGEVPGPLGPVAEIQTETPRQEPQNLLGLIAVGNSRADFGRSGALGGAAADVFGKRVLLGTSSDPKVCAPADFAAKDSATCKPQ